MTKDCISHAMARFLGGGGTRKQQRRGQQRESYRVERQFVFVPHRDERTLGAYTAQPPSIVKAPAVRPSAAAPHGRLSGWAGLPHPHLSPAPGGRVRGVGRPLD